MIEGWSSLQRIYACPQTHIQGHSAYQIDHVLPYAAQVGFWQSELVITKGLVQILSC